MSLNKYFRVVFIIYFGLLISNSQCQTKKTSDMDIKIPKVTNEFEKLNLNKYILSNDEIFSNTLKDGTYVELQKESYGYYESRWNPDSYFIIIKQYNKSGNIKEKGVLFNSGYFRIGTWYYFNMEGQLIKEQNCDLNFNFSFQELRNYLVEKNINLTIGYIEPYTGIHTSIEKQVDTNKSMWIVTWQKDPQLLEEIYLDGNTGKIIKTNEILIEED